MPLNIEFHVSRTGIGDAVCGLYAACGIADAGHSVSLYTRHHEWLRPARHPGVSVVGLRDKEKPRGTDAYARYNDELRASRKGGGSRAAWYSDEVAKATGARKCAPSRPRFVAAPASPLGSDYALIFPHAAHHARTWAGWRAATEVLVAGGIRVIIAGTAKETLQAEFAGSGATYFWGQTSDWVLGSIAGAGVVAGNDSGMVHVAGLLGVRSVAVMAHVRPEFTFAEAPTVGWVAPKSKCRFCHWQPEGGYGAGCSRACSALATVPPTRVAGEISRAIARNRANVAL